MSFLSTKGLSNHYVEKVGRKILKKINFLGVYPCDIHPAINKRKNFSVIFNTGDSTTSGEHFVCLYKNRKNIFYFDSFGNKPDDKNILLFLKKFNVKLIWNSVKIQSDNSNFCGFYCLAFLLSIEHKINFNKFIMLFNKNNLNDNDKIVIYFILKQIK